MRKQDIIQVFRDLGGASTAYLARECIDRGVFAEGDLDAASVRWAQNVCRDALKEIDPTTNLPYAGPTLKKAEDGGPLWRQLALMDYGDLVYNIQERSKGVAADYDILRRIRNYCLERFGTTVEIPRIYTPIRDEIPADDS